MASTPFAEVVSEIVGGRNVREVAKLAGVSHTSIYDWTAGRVVPTRRLLVQVANRLQLPADTRKVLLLAAGYLDDEDTEPAREATVLRTTEAEIHGLLRKLHEDELQAVKRLLEPISAARVIRGTFAGKRPAAGVPA